MGKYEENFKQFHEKHMRKYEETTLKKFRKYEFFMIKNK